MGKFGGKPPPVVDVGVVCGETDDGPGTFIPHVIPAGPGRRVEIRSRPARRDIRSARSASRLIEEGLCWCPRPEGPDAK